MRAFGEFMVRSIVQEENANVAPAIVEISSKKCSRVLTELNGRLSIKACDHILILNRRVLFVTNDNLKIHFHGKHKDFLQIWMYFLFFALTHICGSCNY